MNTNSAKLPGTRPQGLPVLSAAPRLAFSFVLSVLVLFTLAPRLRAAVVPEGGCAEYYTDPVVGGIGPNYTAPGAGDGSSLSSFHAKGFIAHFACFSANAQPNTWQKASRKTTSSCPAR